MVVFCNSKELTSTNSWYADIDNPGCIFSKNISVGSFANLYVSNEIVFPRASRQKGFNYVTVY